MPFREGTGPPQRQVYPAISIGSAALPYIGVQVAAGATYYFRQAIDGVAPLSPHWQASHRFVLDGWLESWTDGADASDLNCYISVLDDQVGVVELPRERLHVVPLVLDRRAWVNNLQITGQHVLLRVANLSVANASFRGWLRIRGV